MSDITVPIDLTAVLTIPTNLPSELTQLMRDSVGDANLFLQKRKAEGDAKAMAEEKRRFALWDLFEEAVERYLPDVLHPYVSWDREGYPQEEILVLIELPSCVPMVAKFYGGQVWNTAMQNTEWEFKLKGYRVAPVTIVRNGYEFYIETPLHTGDYEYEPEHIHRAIVQAMYNYQVMLPKMEQEVAAENTEGAAEQEGEVLEEEVTPTERPSWSQNMRSEIEAALGEKDALRLQAVIAHALVELAATQTAAHFG